ncbi:hypothetical protein PybrP1_001066 [[Pythium] brassicae (nom. inval.)]|nr:hypothetical protein PybrP1_001066 [[Pythium] brassicae (nom. inval.)]
MSGTCVSRAVERRPQVRHAPLSQFALRVLERSIFTHTADAAGVLLSD